MKQSEGSIVREPEEIGGGPWMKVGRDHEKASSGQKGIHQISTVSQSISMNSTNHQCGIALGERGESGHTSTV